MNRELARKLINTALRPFGARIVNAEWGPRGFSSAFGRLAKLGVDPRVILDIGAARGTWTTEAMGVFPAATYYMLDALTENEASLRALCAKHDNAHYQIAALGARPGEQTFRVHGDQSSFFSSEFDSESAGRTVAVTTLDELLAAGKIEAPQLLKADVQGYELEILQGGQKLLESVEFALLEVCFREMYTGAPLTDDVIAAMRDLGFRIYDVCSYCQRPADGELAYGDVVFARRDSHVFSDETYRGRRPDGRSG